MVFVLLDINLAFLIFVKDYNLKGGIDKINPTDVASSVGLGQNIQMF